MFNLSITHLTPNNRWALAMVAFAVLPSLGCSRLSVNNVREQLNPSTQRDWSPEHSQTPSATIEGPVVTVRNIRNNQYLSSEDFVVNYYDRQIQLSNIQTVDYIVVPFKFSPIAHTMISFGLSDGSYLVASVEVRTETGEKYNPVLGVGRQYELTYILGDERDLIQLRTEHRGADVYLYPSTATPAQSQLLFVDMMRRVNELSLDPEFYHTIKNNCTTNLAGHVNQVSPNKIKYGWRVLLPGLSAKYAYDLGLLDNRIPFDELKKIAYVNDLANQYRDHPEFSRLIRSRHDRIQRYANIDQRLGIK